MVTAPGGSGTAYAPVNEAQRTGLVKYLNQGADFVLRNRREDAYKQMHRACRGAYRIDAEGPQAEGSTAMVMNGPLGPMVTANDTEYWYIRFSCVQPVAAR